MQHSSPSHIAKAATSKQIEINAKVVFRSGTIFIETLEILIVYSRFILTGTLKFIIKIIIKVCSHLSSKLSLVDYCTLICRTCGV